MESVYITAGCAHDFQTLTDGTKLHDCHSDPYSLASEAAVDPCDPELAIEWPLPISNMSERDKTHPSFKTIEPVIRTDLMPFVCDAADSKIEIM